MGQTTQVEVEFTIRHSMEELKDEFIRKGRFPEWHAERVHPEGGNGALAYLEKRVIGVSLQNEQERYAWFVFSIEACGELKRQIVIPNVISSGLKIDNLNLDDFLRQCRECLVDQ